MMDRFWLYSINVAPAFFVSVIAESEAEARRLANAPDEVNQPITMISVNHNYPPGFKGCVGGFEETEHFTWLTPEQAASRMEESVPRGQRTNAVHWRGDQVRKGESLLAESLCRAYLGDPGDVRLTREPALVTCQLCLRSRAFKRAVLKRVTDEMRLTFAPLEKLAGKVKLVDVMQHPDGVTRCRVSVTTIPLDRHEAQVAMDHFLKLGEWIGEGE